jgi:hypothetical protein
MRKQDKNIYAANIKYECMGGEICGRFGVL